MDAKTEERERQAIAAVEKARGEAIVKADGAVLDRVLSDSLRHILSHGTVDTKESFVAKRLGTKNAIYRSMKYSNAETRFISDDVAIVHGDLELLEGFRDGRPDRIVEVRFSHVWAKEGDAWRMVHHHSCFRGDPRPVK